MIWQIWENLGFGIIDYQRARAGSESKKIQALLFSIWCYIVAILVWYFCEISDHSLSRPNKLLLQDISVTFAITGITLVAFYNLATWEKREKEPNCCLGAVMKIKHLILAIKLSSKRMHVLKYWTEAVVIMANITLGAREFSFS